MIGSLAPEDLVIQLHKDVIRLAVHEGRHSLFVRKKALLALLRIYRKFKDKFDPREWVRPVLQVFEMQMFSLGFLISSCNFVIGITNLHGPIF